MNAPILVVALDSRGYTLNSPHPEGEENMKSARTEARRLLAHPDYLAEGLHKVEIRRSDECVWDAFVA